MLNERRKQVPTTKKTQAKPKTAKKPTKAKTKAVRSPDLAKELDALKEETARLRAENAKFMEQYGKMMEGNANFRIKANAMLGQILKGLYLLGFGPEDIQAKCQQMFRKKVVAD